MIATLRASLLASALTLPLAAPALAQTPGEASESDAAMLDTIVVTARKREETTLTAPVAVTAVSGEALEARGAVSLTQISALTPGLIAAPTPLMDSYFIRGIGSQPQNPGFEQSVGVFVDGVYYGVGRWGSQGYVDLEAAEVLRGPQATYLGKSTIAGAINLRTKGPGREFEAYVRAGYEFNAKQKSLQAVVSGPITDSFGARLVVRLDDTDGWYRRLDGGHSPTSDEQFARFTAVWEPTESFSLKFIGAWDHLDSDFAGATLRRCAGPGNTADPNPSFGPDPQFCGRKFFVTEAANSRAGQSGLEYDSYAYTLEANYQTPFGLLTSVTGLNRSDGRNIFASNATSANAIYASARLDNKAFSQELRFRTDFDGPLNAVFGAYYQSTDFFASTEAFILPDAVQGGVNAATFFKPSTQDGTSKSLFGELSWAITETLTLDAGGRYTRETKKSFMKNTGAAPRLGFILVPSYAADQTFERFSPSATLTWKPSPDHTLFASYKTGFKSGGFSHGQTIFFFPPATAPDLATLLFGSEKAEGFEGGYKGQLFDRRVRLELIGYSYLYSDLQVNAYNAATNSFTVQNAAAARSKGVEFAGAWAATPELTLSGAVNYSHSRFTRFIAACNSIQVRGVAPCNVPLGPGFGQDLSGRPTPQAPTWSGRFDANYSTELGGYRVTAAAGVQFSSRYLLQNDGRADNAQEAYERYDARLTVAPLDERWELSLIGVNLSNEQVMVFGAERSQSPRDIAAVLDRARQVELRATYRF